MRITKIHIENFRALRSTDIDVEDKLSIIVGKNNTGKTSIKVLLDKFLTGESTNFKLDDFNCDLQKALRECIEEDKDKLDKDILEAGVPEFAIKLFLHISYDKDDDLSNISTAGLITDLDMTKFEVILGCAYHLSPEKYIKLLHAYRARTKKFEEIKQEKDELQIPNVLHLLKNRGVGVFFKSLFFVVEQSDNTKLYKVPTSEIKEKRAIKRSDIQRIIKYEFIDAERDAVNPNDNQKASSTLSALASTYWNIIEHAQNNVDIINKRHELEAQFMLADAELSIVYKDVFQTIFDDITKLSDSKDKLKIESSFQARDLFRQNTCVSYEHKNTNLPEDYNGLGYMNLIEMIFKLKLIKKRLEEYNDGHSADINLLFIEEPEAHMHPQMQVIFINNIKDMLELSNGKTVQTLLSTHSSHIAANVDMEAFKYFINTDTHGVQVKNLRDLKPNGEEPNINEKSTEEEKLLASEFTTYRFIKQHITLNRAEVFFADKIIIIEGDTERMLLPNMIKIIDDENEECEGYAPLSSQNISVIEAGSYAKEFDGLIRFLDIKTLIITDIDYVQTVTKTRKNGSTYTVREKTTSANADDTSNPTIKHYLNGYTISQIREAEQAKRTVNKILIAYQQEEEGYYARSFEDAFIALNHEWLKMIESHLKQRGAIKNAKTFVTSSDFYKIAEECVKSKTAFAVSMIYESQRKPYISLKIPNYIKEGLLWLSK